MSSDGTIPGAPADIRIANTLRVIRDRPGAPARLEIDGELFPYGTLDGFTVHPRRGELPGVALSIVAWRVEVVDDAGASTAES